LWRTDTAVATLHQGAPGHMTLLKILRPGRRPGWHLYNCICWKLTLNDRWPALHLQWPVMTCLSRGPGAANDRQTDRHTDTGPQLIPPSHSVAREKVKQYKQSAGSSGRVQSSELYGCAEIV